MAPKRRLVVSNSEEGSDDEQNNKLPRLTSVAATSSTISSSSQQHIATPQAVPASASAAKSVTDSEDGDRAEDDAGACTSSRHRAERVVEHVVEPPDEPDRALLHADSPSSWTAYVLNDILGGPARPKPPLPSIDEAFSTDADEVMGRRDSGLTIRGLSPPDVEQLLVTLSLAVEQLEDRRRLNEAIIIPEKTGELDYLKLAPGPDDSDISDSDDSDGGNSDGGDDDSTHERGTPTGTSSNSNSLGEVNPAAASSSLPPAPASRIDSQERDDEGDVEGSVETRDRESHEEVEDEVVDQADEQQDDASDDEENEHLGIDEVKHRHDEARVPRLAAFFARDEESVERLQLLSEFVRDVVQPDNPVRWDSLELAWQGFGSRFKDLLIPWPPLPFDIFKKSLHNELDRGRALGKDENISLFLILLDCVVPDNVELETRTSDGKRAPKQNPTFKLFQFLTDVAASSLNQVCVRGDDVFKECIGSLLREIFREQHDSEPTGRCRANKDMVAFGATLLELLYGVLAKDHVVVRDVLACGKIPRVALGMAELDASMYETPEHGMGTVELGGAQANAFAVHHFTIAMRTCHRGVKSVQIALTLVPLSAYGLHTAPDAPDSTSSSPFATFQHLYRLAIKHDSSTEELRLTSPARLHSWDWLEKRAELEPNDSVANLWRKLKGAEEQIVANGFGVWWKKEKTAVGDEPGLKGRLPQGYLDLMSRRIDCGGLSSVVQFSTLTRPAKRYCLFSASPELRDKLPTGFYVKMVNLFLAPKNDPHRRLMEIAPLFFTIESIEEVLGDTQGKAGFMNTVFERLQHLLPKPLKVRANPRYGEPQIRRSSGPLVTILRATNLFIKPYGASVSAFAAIKHSIFARYPDLIFGSDKRVNAFIAEYEPTEAVVGGPTWTRQDGLKGKKGEAGEWALMEGVSRCLQRFMKLAWGQKAVFWVQCPEEDGE
ncbi:hypothetical protein Rhopal_005804-T1 [Rhodotorula paludigena]|uniref:Uncharacterized protein n=1 Tax=Rhodotorula paludigena TaxID=86838 RepID=A0AAV5GK95_9BASI|nr:hypothetical protein Rhopal_005804-T1 [Rhodotorula paludigena]